MEKLGLARASILSARVSMTRAQHSAGIPLGAIPWPHRPFVEKKKGNICNERDKRSLKRAKSSLLPRDARPRDIAFALRHLQRIPCKCLRRISNVQSCALTERFLEERRKKKKVCRNNKYHHKCLESEKGKIVRNCRG